MSSIVVVGGGAVGLATAWVLVGKGYHVIVVSDRAGEDCVSGGAGAIWEFPPFQIEPLEEARGWLMASLDVFNILANDSDTGVVQRRVGYYFCTSTCVVPRGTEGLAGFGYFNASAPNDSGLSLPIHACVDRPEFIGREFLSGFYYSAPVIHMRSYLPWLRSRLIARGVCFVTHRVTNLEKPLLGFQGIISSKKWDLIVNCTGLQSGVLCHDDNIYPLRGSMVFVHAPMVSDVVCDESFQGPALCYIVPQKNGVVACAGCTEANNTSIDVDLSEQKAILARCYRLVPALVDARVVGTWAGLRPARRGGCRIELQPISSNDAPRIIHNYGHGGSGVVTSWGCADVVARLVASVFSPVSSPASSCNYLRNTSKL